MANDTGRPSALTPRAEQDQISRAILLWLNTWPGRPADVTVIGFEALADDKPGMALSTIQGAYLTKRYLRGGYRAVYQYKVIYRVQPSTTGGRLKGDETLDALADWCISSPLPVIGAGRQPIEMACNARASLFARYENGDEDHQIIMTLTYTGQ